MLSMMITGKLSDFRENNANPDACGWAVLTETFYEKGEKQEFKWVVWIPEYCRKQCLKVIEKKWTVAVFSEKLSYRQSENGGIKLAVQASKINTL